MRQLLCLISFLSACSSEVARNNPFDPEAAPSIQARARLEGQVLLEEAASHAGAVATIREAGGGGATLSYTATSAEDGSFAVEVPAGTYHVTIARAGYGTARRSDLAVGPGEARSLGVIALAVARGAMTGKVILDDGAPPTGTAVSLVPLDRPGAAPTTVLAGGDGTWFAGGLMAGDYVIRAEKESYAPAYTAPAGSLFADEGGTAVEADTVQTAPTLRLYPASAIVQTKVDGQLAARYTNSPGIDVQLLAFVPFLVDMKVSEDSDAGTEWRQFAAEIPFQIEDTDGPHTIRARFRDSFGLVSDVFSTTVVLDQGNPVVTRLELEGGARFLTGDDTSSVTATALDLLSGLEAWRMTTADTFSDEVWARVDSVGPTATLAAFAALGDAPGEKTVLLQVRDRAGNVSDAASATIFRDRTRPVLGVPALRVDPLELAGGNTDTVRSADVTLIFNVTGDRPGERLYMAVANASGLDANAAFVPFQSPYLHRLAAGPDGGRNVCAIFRDEAGLVTEEKCIELELDSSGPTGPKVLVEEHDSRPTNGATGVTLVTLMLSAGESPATANVAENPALTGAITVDMTAGAQPISAFFDLGGAGQRTVWARFYDAAGNESALAAATVLVDLTPPSPAAPSLSPSGWTRNTTILLTPPAAGQDEVRLSGDVVAPSGFVPAPPGVPIPVTLTDGDTEKTLVVTWRDLADNTDGPSPLKITLDSKEPEGCVLDPAGNSATGGAAPAGKTAKTQFTAALTGCSETPAQIYLALGDVTCSAVPAEGWQPYSASATFTLPPVDGSYTLRGCARDAAGNVGTIDEGTIELDTSPPTGATVVVDGGAAYVNGAQVTARGGYVASVAGSAAGAVAWALSEGGAFSNFTDAVTDNPRLFTFGGAGARTVYAVFRDDLGNLSAAAADSIVFDTQAPSGGALSVISPTSNGYTSSVSAVLELTVPDDAAQVTLASAQDAGTCAEAGFDGRTPQPAATFLSFLLPPSDGPKRVCARFGDVAGNFSAPASGTISLLATPPAGLQLSLFASPDNDGTTSLVTGTTEATTSALSLNVRVARQCPTARAADFDRLQFLGGPDARGTWTDATDPALDPCQGSGPLLFPVRLDPGTDTLDALNLISLRARDKAGNVSAAATVSLTHQKASTPLAPTGLSLIPRPSSVLVSWTASASQFTSGYSVSYGPSTAYGGAGAEQGPSPVEVGNPCDGAGRCRFTLSGLTLGVPIHVGVTAVSALQRGASAGPVSATPQVANPIVLGSAAFQSAGYGAAVLDNRAYVVETNGLEVFDLSNPYAPASLGCTPYDRTAGRTCATAVSPKATDGSGAIAVRWPYAYVPAAGSLWVFNLASEPPAFVYQGTLFDGSYTYRIFDLTIRGDRLWAAAVDGCNARPGLLWFSFASPASTTQPSAPSFRIRGGNCSGGQPSSAMGAVGVYRHKDVVFQASDLAGIDVWEPNTTPLNYGSFRSCSGVSYPSGTNGVSRLIVEPLAGSAPRLYVLQGNGTLSLVDYTLGSSSPISCTAAVRGSLSGLPSGGGALAAAGGEVYVAAGGSFFVVSTAIPATPGLLGSVALPAVVGTPRQLVLEGAQAIMVGAGGLAMVQVGNPQYPRVAGQTASAGDPWRAVPISVQGRVAYVQGAGTLRGYNVGDAAAPAGVGTSPSCAGNLYYGGMGTWEDLVFAENCGTVRAFYGANLVQPPAWGSSYDLSGLGGLSLELYRPGLGAAWPWLVAAQAKRPDLTGSGDPNTCCSALFVYDLRPVASGNPPQLMTPGHYYAYPSGAQAATVGIDVHRDLVFWGLVDGFQVMSPSTITPGGNTWTTYVRKTGVTGVRSISARLGRCGAVPCWDVFLSTTGGLRVFTWTPSTNAVADLGTLSGSTVSLLASGHVLLQGFATGDPLAGGLGFLDTSLSPPNLHSVSRLATGGGIMGLGLAGRFAYANINGQLVIEELQ